MPNTAINQLISATMMMPTTTDKLPSLTADRICPAMMQLIVPYPTIRIMLRKQVIFAGQYPMKYRATT